LLFGASVSSAWVYRRAAFGDVFGERGKVFGPGGECLCELMGEGWHEPDGAAACFLEVAGGERRMFETKRR
jgi:hypothetical protein